MLKVNAKENENINPYEDVLSMGSVLSVRIINQLLSVLCKLHGILCSVFFASVRVSLSSCMEILLAIFLDINE